MLKRVPEKVLRWFQRAWRKAWWSKALLITVGWLVGLLLVNYNIASWYIDSTRDKPLKLGVTFVPDYARSLGLDAEETLDALIKDANVRHFRLVSYWNKIEKEQGTYDFRELDQQFQKIEAVNGTVSLAIGMRQPRWPECHAPEWAEKLPVNERQKQLEKFISRVVNRYKTSPALTSYQLENEALLKDFGECPDASRERLQAEFDLVKKLDPNRPIIMSKSNNFPLLSLGTPRPDKVGMSVYRRVWNENLYKGYFTYPLPSWYYAAMAGWQKIWTGKDSVLHEMQMEPWPPRGQFVADTPLAEQYKSMDPTEFESRVNFAKNTGMREIYLWGAEWWYYTKHNDDARVWNAAKETFRKD